MDIQAYISSGILESYVLGELEPSDARQVEEMAARYPEIQQELQLTEETLEDIAQSAAISPPAALRTAIFDQLPPTAPKAAAEESPIRPLYPAQPAESRTYYHTWMVAASLGLALVSSLTALYFWNRWQGTEAQLASLLTQNTVLVQHVSTLENRTEEMQESLAVLTDPSFKAVPMKGLDPAPNAQAFVYWNPATAEVYLNPGSLPEAPAGKQYQLWAIVDGQPVDAGVFNTTGEAVKAMKEIQNASAFAVTLEPEGGSPSPTMDQMYVMGAAS